MKVQSKTRLGQAALVNHRISVVNLALFGILRMCERMVSTLEQAIREELAGGLANILGDKLEAVILYGSYARGTQDAESDIDIALILCGKPGRNTTDRLQDFLTDVNKGALQNNVK